MDKEIKDFNGLISNAADFLKLKLLLSEATVEGYRKHWRRLRNIMYSHGIKCFNNDLANKICCYEFENRKLHELLKHEKNFYRGIQILVEFAETNKISPDAIIPRKSTIVFDGAIGELILQFVHYKEINMRLSKNRISCYKRKLHEFLDYCNYLNIKSIEKVDLATILHFIYKAGLQKRNDMFKLTSSLRVFFNYLYEQNILTFDFSAKIPRYKRITQSKIPSTYTKEEIEKLLSSINRSNSLGKRNYAILLIIVRLGIRALDVCKLKFEHIHWATSIIKFEQCKTGKTIILPLLPDVGNAIIDYLRFGRPQSEEPYVFLMEKPPFEHFSSSGVVTHIVQRAYQKAGINIDGKRYGAHSLRHSLTLRMLQKNTALPIISEVLGHQNTESTRYYLRIDINSMKHCILDVPQVQSSFYEQKGGTFYE